MQAEIPIQGAQAKLLGPSQEDGLRSLAAKIWMIDHAEHTIDATYYIFSRDRVGRAMLGALCNAVDYSYHQCLKPQVNSDLESTEAIIDIG
jgi:phosphatidylserine/phosphatidylglycerophosphate/cardiolipin synthase-like enzyme